VRNHSCGARLKRGTHYQSPEGAAAGLWPTVVSQRLERAGFYPHNAMALSKAMMEKIAMANARVLDRLELESDRFLIVSAHRRENIDVPVRLAALLDTLER
jgi:UDP-N-acetylglucosamine 2-epimerase